MGREVLVIGVTRSQWPGFVEGFDIARERIERARVTRSQWPGLVEGAQTAAG